MGRLPMCLARSVKAIFPWDLRCFRRFFSSSVQGGTPSNRERSSLRTGEESQWEKDYSKLNIMRPAVRNKHDSTGKRNCRHSKVVWAWGLVGFSSHLILHWRQWLSVCCQKVVTIALPSAIEWTSPPQPQPLPSEVYDQKFLGEATGWKQLGLSFLKIRLLQVLVTQILEEKSSASDIESSRR